MKKILHITCAALAATAAYAQAPQNGASAPLQIPAPAAQMFGTPAQSAPNFAQPQSFANPLGTPNAQAEQPKPDPEKFAALFPEIEGATDKIGRGFAEKYGAWIAAAAALAAILAAFALRRRKTPAIPPAERATARIELARDISQKLGAKAYASEVSQAVRDYIEEAHDIPAPERTTEEFLKIVSESDEFDDDGRESLKKILTLADMAKFAQHVFANAPELAETALAFVDSDDAKTAERRKQKDADSKKSAPETPDSHEAKGDAQ